MSDKNKTWLEKVIYYDVRRPALTFVYSSDNGFMYASDGYSLFVVKNDNSFPYGYISTKESEKLSVTIEEYDSPFPIDSAKYLSEKKYEKSVTIDLEEIKKVITQHLLFEQAKRFCSTRFYVGNNNILMCTKNAERGEIFSFVKINGYPKNHFDELYEIEPYKTDKRLWGVNTLEQYLKLLGEYDEIDFDLTRIKTALTGMNKKEKLVFSYDDNTCKLENKDKFAITMGLSK